MKTRTTPPEILHRGSLMTYRDNGTEKCFGYLFNFTGHGVFEPTFGKLEVTPEEAQSHNRLLSQAEIQGLDGCAVGLGGMFYSKKESGHTVVTTWMGEVVSRDVQVHGQVITFVRNNMTFRGRLRRDDCFGFKRIQ